MEGELAIGESLAERVPESYLDGGLLIQLQTLGGQCDELMLGVWGGEGECTTEARGQTKGRETREEFSGGLAD